MNRRADLPGPDAPSPEVLDELLRAFAADTTDAAKLQHIDLTSPEVDELITGSPSGTPRPDAEPADETAGEREPAMAEEVAPAAAVQSEAVPETAEEAAPTVEPEGSPHDVEAGVEPAPSGGSKRIVIIDHESAVIEESNGPVDGVRAVPPGDPLLAAAANAETAPLVTQVLEDGRVFIDDTAAPDAITMEEAVTATRIEPRLRERRTAVKKAKTRRRLKWFLICFAVIALIVGALAVLGSGIFAIEEVAVEGADQADPEAVDAVVEELLGTPVLRADTDAAEAALEAIPWVQDARVTTDFPHGARIELRERTAAAAYEGTDGSFRVIDAEGRVLEIVDAPPDDLLPITADAAPDVRAGQFAPTGYRAAASLIEALTPTMKSGAESVQVTADGSDLRLLLTEGIEVRFGASQDLVAKLVRLQTWMDVGRDGPVRTVDVSTDEVTTS